MTANQNLLVHVVDHIIYFTVIFSFEFSKLEERNYNKYNKNYNKN